MIERGAVNRRLDKTQDPGQARQNHWDTGMRLPTGAFLRDNAPWLSAGVLLAFSSSYGQTYFISVFAGEIRAEFGLSHASWGAIYSAGTLMAAGLMVFVGPVTDRLRIRALGGLVFAGLALACLAMAAVPAAWALVPVILALRFAGQGMSGHLATTAMARWFVATRGRALATATLGFAAGEALLPLVFVSLLTVLDWRTLWAAAAVLPGIAIPLLYGLLRRERVPQGADGMEQAPGLDGRHWTRAEVIRHPLFWWSIPVVMGPAAFITALFFQQVHVADTKGWSHVELVALFPIYTAASVAAMLGSGLLIDRFGTRRLMPIFQLPLALGFVLMRLAETPVLGAVAFALVGMTQGTAATLPTAFWADHYGTRYLGAVRALAMALLVFGTAIGPVLSGVIIDFGIDYPRQMPVLAVVFLASSLGIAFALAGLPKPAPRAG